jgi:hypothetical protein
VLLLITILYSRKLDYETYGMYQSIWMYASLINIIGSFGVSSLLLSIPLPAFIGFVKRYKKEITAFYLLLFVAIVLFFYVYEQNLAPATKGLLILLFAARNVSSIGEVLLIKNHKEYLFLPSMLFTQYCSLPAIITLLWCRFSSTSCWLH